MDDKEPIAKKKKIFKGKTKEVNFLQTSKKKSRKERLKCEFKNSKLASLL